MFQKNFFKIHFDHNLNHNLDRTTFICNRIKIVEKYFPELGKAFYDYIDKSARSRDCTDKIAVVLNNYGKAENVTFCFKHQTIDFANILLNVGTEKDSQVQTLQTKILKQLNECYKICEVVQTELKSSLIANEKERNWLKQLERAKKAQPKDLQRISITEAEVFKAKKESHKSSKNLEEYIDTFEMRKLIALKESLLAWTLAELQFHSKALQLFTDAYHIAADMDVSSDIKEFRNKLRSTKDAYRSD